MRVDLALGFRGAEVLYGDAAGESFRIVLGRLDCRKHLREASTGSRGAW